MKTLSKLNIKSEKLLNDNELKSLKGGWSGMCEVYGVSYFNGPAYGSSQAQVQQACQNFWGSTGSTCHCF